MKNKKYIYASILTDQQIFSNNRGKSEGGHSTLQKVISQGENYTTVSAESIRYALRSGYEKDGFDVGRKTTSGGCYKQESYDEIKHIDDDVMGYMKAVKGNIVSRKSPLSVSRAKSLDIWGGDMTFNCLGDKDKGKASEGKLSIYTIEMHDTRYQCTLACDTQSFTVQDNIKHTFNGLVNIPGVGGRHSTNYTDFSPDSIVLRVTFDHSGKIQNCYNRNDNDNSISIDKVIRKVKNGDIDASEIIVGGDIFSEETVKLIKSLGIQFFDGVKKAVNEALSRVGI